MCPFCHTELLPVPPLSDTGSDADDAGSDRGTPRSSQVSFITKHQLLNMVF